jgi:hypothetical protein
VTWVSRAGVRVDDDLRARFADRLGLYAVLLVALALMLTPLAVARVLVPLAEVRRLVAVGEHDAAARIRPSAHRTAWVAVAILSPLALIALAIGAGAAWGW